MNNQQDQLRQMGIKVLEAAKQGNEEAKQIVNIATEALQDQNKQQQIQQMMQSQDQNQAQQAAIIAGTMIAIQESQSQYAKMGAKLQYLKRLKSMCPDGYEVSYYANGGNIVKGCKKCQKAKKAMEGSKMSPIEEFKCGGKKKKKK